jgi:phage gp36-like protein
MATRFLTEDELRMEYTAATIDALADRDGNGSPDAGVVESAILDAEDEALARLRNRFTDTEIPAVPAAASRMVKVQVAALAYFNLYKVRAAMPQAVRDGRFAAMEMLKLIQLDQLSALLEEQPAVDTARPIVASVRRSVSSREEPIFLRAMRDWGHFVP